MAVRGRERYYVRCISDMLEVDMNNVKCNHCGVKIDKDEAIECVWDDFNLIWYYCKRCNNGVFGSNINKIGEDNNEK